MVAAPELVIALLDCYGRGLYLLNRQDELLDGNIGRMLLCLCYTAQGFIKAVGGILCLLAQNV